MRFELTITGLQPVAFASWLPDQKNWDPIISILFPHRSGQHGGVDNWCSREDSNLHGRYVPLGSQPSVSAYSTTRANMVPKVGLEPTPPEGDRFLRPARLPVPPLRRIWWSISESNREGALAQWGYSPSRLHIGLMLQNWRPIGVSIPLLLFDRQM